MTAAAFRGTYADFKLIKTRGVVSISFEVPVEQAQTVLDVLGGMPVAASEVWCGIARLQKEVMRNDDGKREGGLCATSTSDAPDADRPSTVTPPRRQETPPVDGAKTRMAFRDLRMANQAGILCDTPAFHRFLAEKVICNPDLFDAKQAADYVRRHCNVASRSDIRPRTPSGDRWSKLVDEYRTWMHMPELVA